MQFDGFPDGVWRGPARVADRTSEPDRRLDREPPRRPVFVRGMWYGDAPDRPRSPELRDNQRDLSVFAAGVVPVTNVVLRGLVLPGRRPARTRAGVPRSCVQDLRCVGWPRLSCEWTRNLTVFAQVKAKREDLSVQFIDVFRTPGLKIERLDFKIKRLAMRCSPG
jgi:hypothetical protein